MNRLLSLPARISIGFGAAALIASLAAPAVLGAQPGIVLNLDMFSNCLGGSAAPSATVNITWRASNNALKTQGSAASGSTGGWEFCAANVNTWIAPADKIKISDGTSTRSYVVPNLNMAVDRVSGLVTGTGPAQRTLRLCPTWRFSDFGRCHSVRVAQDGTWTYHEPGGIAGAWVDVRWTSPNGDKLSMSAHAQDFAVTLGKSTFSGHVGTPRSAVHLELNGGAKATGDVMSDQYGDFSGQLVDHHGRPVTVSAGDDVSASIASDAHWIMPQIVATPDRVNDTAAGNCSDTGTPYWDVEITVLHSGHYRGSAFADLDEDGNFTADFRDPGGFFDSTNIKRGDRLVVACELTTEDSAQLKVVVH